MNLELVLSSGEHPDVYEVDASSSAGHATGELRLDIDRLLSRRPQLQSTVLASAVSARRTLETTEIPVRRVGEELFGALFTGAVYGRYVASIATARARGEALRLVLHVRAPELAALPWETLFDPEAGEYLCQSEPLVRHVDVAVPVAPLSVEPPLRVLGIVASPTDLVQLDVEAERDRLSEALRSPIQHGDLELAWAAGGRWSDVQTSLLDGPWHIVHFIGHGGYDDRHREGVLALVGGHGEADMVGAERFTRLLRTASPSPRLIVLNSCSSGTAASDDLFSSTAASLVRSGIPAAVAMQFTVSDAAAAVFAGGFYSAIAHNRSIGEAVRVGRIAIDGISPNTLEWVTPVVYLRGEDLPVFTVEATHREVGPATAPSSGEADERTDRLESLYVQALAELRTGHDDAALALFDSIVAVEPDYRDAAARRELLGRARRAAFAYDEATESELDGRFAAAARAYEAALEIDPEYRDARERAEGCRRRQRVLDLVAELRIHADAGDDDAVISTADELASLDPDLADPDGLVTAARRHLVEREREAVDAARYDQAREAEIEGNWESAIAGYAALAGERPDYRDTSERVAACRDQQRIEQLHDRVRRLSADEQWDEVTMLGDDLADIDPAAADPGGLVTAARGHVAERERIDTLCAERYDEGRDAENRSDWSQAILAYESIVDVRPDHRDSRDRLATCRVRLDEEVARREAERVRVEEELAAAFDRGVALQTDGDWERAITAFDEVLERRPDHVDAARRRAACLRRHERELELATADVEPQAVEPEEPDPEPAPASVPEPEPGLERASESESADVLPAEGRRRARRRVRAAAAVAGALLLAGAAVFVASRDGDEPVSPDWNTALLSVGIDEPKGVEVGDSGGLYITEGGRVRRFEPSGAHWYSGSDGADFWGDGGAPSEPSFVLPWGIAHHDGNTYVADADDTRIRLIDADGIVTTFAGPDTLDFEGDDGSAFAVDLTAPYGVAVDDAGNVYIADTFNDQIRKIDIDGVITTIAGNGRTGHAGDGGPAIQASLNRPYGLDIDEAGNVYVADTHNHRVRKIDTDGVITTVAGTGEIDFSGDGGPASNAALDSPNDVAVDDSGTLYITDTHNHRIRRVDSDGVITTIAGAGRFGANTGRVPATEGHLELPRSIALDGETIYVAESGSLRIRMIDVDGMMSTIVR